MEQCAGAGVVRSSHYPHSMTVKEQIENIQQRLETLGGTVMSTASSAGHAVASATTRKRVSSEDVMQLESDHSAHKYVGVH